jgi:hypothetical protein
VIFVHIIFSCSFEHFCCSDQQIFFRMAFHWWEIRTMIYAKTKGSGEQLSSLSIRCHLNFSCLNILGNKLDMNVHWVNTLAKLEFFVLIRNSTWPILCSDWLIFQKSTSQKPLGRFDYDIVDMFITWSCTSFKFSVLIKKQYINIWLYGKMNVSFSFDTTNMIELKQYDH